MSGKAEEKAVEIKTEVVEADPEAQPKIERAREKFLARLAADRPRIAVVYETMEVEGNTVRVRVASETLHEEVMRQRTETLLLLAGIAGVRGPIELEATIDETIQAAKPIRIEDKIKYLADHKPEFNNLRRTLEMEVE
jgi:DNA polymerase-3 subunit gamma/tau